MSSLQTTPPHMPAVMPGTSLPQTQQAAEQLQLHDIHLPEQVSSLPTAIGWWVLSAMIIFSTVWLIKRFKRNKRLHQSKNNALSTLNKQKTLNNAELLSLLKWGAMQYFNRQQIANLYGDAFQQFLRAQLPEKHKKEFETLSKQAFSMQYQADIDKNKDNKGNSKVVDDKSNNVTPTIIDNDCRNAVKLWLTHALPPIKKKNTDNNLANGGLAHD